jgi:hypothetical protein
VVVHQHKLSSNQLYRFREEWTNQTITSTIKEESSLMVKTNDNHKLSSNYNPSTTTSL